MSSVPQIPEPVPAGHVAMQPSWLGRMLGRVREVFKRNLLPGLVLQVFVISAIYSLPLPLQIPVQNLVMCFWCILLIFLTDATD